VAMGLGLQGLHSYVLSDAGCDWLAT